MAFYNKASFWNGIGNLGLYIMVFLAINGIISNPIRFIGSIFLVLGIIATISFLLRAVQNG